LIAVVDDDAHVCRAVSSALAATGYRVRTFTRARDYLDELASLEPVCLLADLRLPELDGIAMYRATQRDGLDVPTVFMTAVSDVSTIVSAMKSGAADLLPKPFSLPALLSAVRACTERALQARAERRQLAALWRDAATLTRRESEVVALVASGHLNKQIAAEIGVGEKTVKVHRARAMQKLRAHSVADLVRTVDRLLTAPSRSALLVDGTEIRRPAAIDAMVNTLGGAARSVARAR